MAAHEQPFLWVPEANKMNDWGTCLHKSKMENLFPKGARPFFKKRHTEGFSWSSSAHISWFPSVAFWFHHPGKKAIHLDLLLPSLAGPDLSAPQPGGRCCTQEGHWFKSKWQSAWYLSRELVCLMVWSPRPAATCDSLCVCQTVYWWQKSNHPTERICKRYINARNPVNAVIYDSTIAIWSGVL